MTRLVDRLGLATVWPRGPRGVWAGGGVSAAGIHFLVAALTLAPPSSRAPWLAGDAASGA